MTKVAELTIHGHRLVIKSSESEDYIRAVEEHLNHTIEEVKHSTKAVSTLDLALLAALNITGEVIRANEKLDEMDRRSEELAELIDERLP